MSKLGFDKVIKKIPKLEQNALKEMIGAARKEFKKNFDNQSNTETGIGWEPVLRGEPPPILDVTGELRAQAIRGGFVTIQPPKARLTIDPIDKDGRGYAQYHQDGIGVHERAFVTQSETLDNVQKNIILDNCDKTFKD